MTLETEYVVREFATQNQIEVKGSYNPAVYDLDVQHFLNGGHPKRDVFYPIFGLAKQ